MEFIDKFLGVKKRRQESLLNTLGISGELRKELVGPGLEKAEVVQVDNAKFLESLKARGIKEVTSHLVARSDTHLAYYLYIDVDEGVKLKTMASSVDYSKERTLFSDLREMSFRYDPEEIKGEWGVYKLKEAKSE